MQYAVSKWEKERVRESENLRQGRGCCRPSSVSNWEKVRVRDLKTWCQVEATEDQVQLVIQRNKNLRLGGGHWRPSSDSDGERYSKRIKNLMPGRWRSVSNWER